MLNGPKPAAVERVLDGSNALGVVLGPVLLPPGLEGAAAQRRREERVRGEERCEGGGEYELQDLQRDGEELLER